MFTFSIKPFIALDTLSSSLEFSTSNPSIYSFIFGFKLLCSIYIPVKFLAIELTIFILPDEEHKIFLL